MKNIRHYILTRFNLGVFGTKSEMFGRIRLDPEAWMRHRMELFLQYTLPSMVGQTCQNFTWLLLLDDQTPPQWRQLLTSIRYANLRLIYVDIIRDGLLKPMLNELPSGDYTLITTRIDNDDAFHRDAIARLQQCCMDSAPDAETWAAVFLWGAVFNPRTREFFLCRHPANNCLSVIESSRDPKTVWYYKHTEIPQKFPTVMIDQIPYWLMLCHDQNVSNRMQSSGPFEIFRDKPVPLELLAQFTIRPLQNQHRITSR